MNIFLDVESVLRASEEVEEARREITKAVVSAGTRKGFLDPLTAVGMRIARMAVKVTINSVNIHVRIFSVSYETENLSTEQKRRVQWKISLLPKEEGVVYTLYTRLPVLVEITEL